MSPPEAIPCLLCRTCLARRVTTTYQKITERSKIKRKKVRKEYLSSNESKVSRISTGLGAGFAPVDETHGVLGVPGHAEGIDEAGGEYRLLKTVGPPLSIERRKDKANGSKVVDGFAESVEELPEFGALLGGGFALLNPVEQTY